MKPTAPACDLVPALAAAPRRGGLAVAEAVSTVSAAPAARLIVFADDWGRHPSSCQHLVRRLLPRYPTLWVNTIGTRPVRLDRADLARAARRLGQWLRPARDARPAADRPLPQGLGVVSPWMYPGFRTGWQRRLNAWAIERCLTPHLARSGPAPRIALTTLPLTADLVGRLNVDRWVYYCVDDWAVWPGLDGQVMRQMERELVERVDAAVAVSEVLQDHLAAIGRPASLLTHGIDLDHWQTPRSAPPAWWHNLARPIFLFWGLIDRRLDTAWCRSLAQAGGTLVLVGPQQQPDPVLAQLPAVQMPGPVAYEMLPTLAAAADVLVMPYADLPVTRAMQPLKLKEYLATGKPAVVRDLPAARPWADAADLADSADDFVRIALERADTGLPASQARARTRLSSESWAAKAQQLEAVLADLVDQERGG